MPSACNHNCNQGRACTCAPGPAVIKTRPSLLARLRRWWALRPLHEQLAGLEAEHAAIFEEVSELMAAQFLPLHHPDANRHQVRLQMRRLELLNITQRRLDVLKRIHAIEVGQ